MIEGLIWFIIIAIFLIPYLLDMREEKKREKKNAEINEQKRIIISHHNQKAHNAYCQYLQQTGAETATHVFPGGETQVNKGIATIGRLCNIDLENQDENGYFQIIMIYTSVYLYFISGILSQERIEEMILQLYPLFIKDNFVASWIVEYVRRKMTGDNSFDLELDWNRHFRDENIISF